VRSGDDVRLRACTLIASAARNVGMDLQCQEADTPTFWNPLRAGTFDLAIVEMPVSLDPGAALTAAFDPSQITPQSGGQNYSGYSSGAVHRLLDTAANTLTPDLYQTQVLRGELLDQAQEAVHADLPALPLYSQDTLEGFARTIAGRPHVPSDFFLAPGVNSSVFYDWRPAPPRTS
jgi:ABC-type transport system substrate-binding protein